MKKSNGTKKVEVSEMMNEVSKRLDRLYYLADRGYRMDEEWHSEVGELRAQYSMLKRM